MKRRRLMLYSIALVIILLLVGCKPGTDTKPGTSGSVSGEDTLFSSGADELKKWNETFMVGSTGGVWAICGGAATDIWQRTFSGLQLTLMPGGGVSNMEALQQDTAKLAFGKTSSTVDGWNGKKPFTQKTDKVRELAFMGHEVLQVIVYADSDIHSVADLKGKILTTSQQGNTVVQMAEELLSCYGLTFDDMKQVHYLSQNDSVAQMKDGKADCFIVSTALPASAVLELATGRKLRLISLEDEVVEKMKEINVGYIPHTVPAGAYNFMEEDCKTITTGLHIAISSDVSDAAAYALAKSLAENCDTVAAVHVMFKDLTPEMLATEIGVPFHDGVRKYYEEAGLLKPSP